MATKYIIILSLLLNNISWAQDSVVLPKDAPAPFAGILLSPEKAQELKNAVIERDGYLKLNDSFKKSLDLSVDMVNKQDEKVKLLMDQNDNLAKSLYSERSMSDVTKIIIFGAGVLSTVLIMYGVQKVKQ